MAKIKSGISILNKVSEEVNTKRESHLERVRKHNRAVFIRRMLVVTILLVGLFSGVSFATDYYDTQNIKDRKIASIKKNISEYEKVKITLKSGETVWGIQEQLTPGEDTRKNLYLVEYLNNRSFENVKSGETITFLKLKDVKKDLNR